MILAALHIDESSLIGETPFSGNITYYCVGWLWIMSSFQFYLLLWKKAGHDDASFHDLNFLYAHIFSFLLHEERVRTTDWQWECWHAVERKKCGNKNYYTSRWTIREWWHKYYGV